MDKSNWKELSSSPEIYQAVVDGLDHPIYVLKPDGEIEFINIEGAQRLKHTPDEMVGTSIWDYFPEDAVKAIKRDIATVIDEDCPAEWERQTPVAGEVRWFDTRMIPLHDEHEKVVSVLGISRDITERKHAEQALRQSEEKYRSLVENSDLAILTLDRDGMYSFMNAANAEYLGVAAEEAIGRRIWDYLPNRAAQKVMDFIQPVLQDGLKTRRDTWVVFKGGGFWFDERAVPIRDRDGEITSALIIAKDITERKHAEQQLQSKNVALHELLEAVEIKKAELGRNVQANVDSTVIPLLNDLWSNVDSSARPHLDAVLKALGDITSPFASKLYDRCRNLSPAEMKIAHLIASGMATKDIARYQHTAPATVSKQRESIRRKLELTGKKISLSSYLKSLLGDSHVR